MPTIKEYFQNIATAIKQKNSEIVTVTPAQMPQAILDIPSGGGISFVEPTYENFTGGYVSNDKYILTSSPNYINDMYTLEDGHKYIVTLGNYNDGQFSMLHTTVPTYGSQYNRNGNAFRSYYGVNNSAYKVTGTSTWKYITITKSINGNLNVKSYVIDCTDWS